MITTFKEYEKFHSYDMLTEDQRIECDALVDMLWEHVEQHNNDLSALDENVLTRLIGSAAGFVVGPAIGKVIARALGVEKGVLFDLFSSRLVGAAIGDAITKYVTGR